MPEIKGRVSEILILIVGSSGVTNRQATSQVIEAPACGLYSMQNDVEVCMMSPDAKIASSFSRDAKVRTTVT